MSSANHDNLSTANRHSVGLAIASATALFTGLFALPAFSQTTGSNNESGIHKIKHVIVIMQENRSFDHYFGTFPGVDGLPMKNGLPKFFLPNRVELVAPAPSSSIRTAMAEQRIPPPRLRPSTGAKWMAS